MEDRLAADLVLVAIQDLESALQSLCTCSMTASSVRHQHQNFFLALAFVLCCIPVSTAVTVISGETKQALV